MPADIASEIVKFTISIPRESCTNAKAKYSSSVVPLNPSVHFYHWRCPEQEGEMSEGKGPDAVAAIMLCPLSDAIPTVIELDTV